MDDPLVIIGHALGCQLRVDLLRVLGEEGMTPTQAARALGCAASTAHFHMGVLTAAGLAKKKGRRRGCKYTWPSSRWELVCKDKPNHEPAPSMTE